MFTVLKTVTSNLDSPLLAVMKTFSSISDSACHWRGPRNTPAQWGMILAFYKWHTEDLMLHFTWGQCCGIIPGGNLGLFMVLTARTQALMLVGCSGIHPVLIFPPPRHVAHRTVVDMNVGGKELAVRALCSWEWLTHSAGKITKLFTILGLWWAQAPKNKLISKIFAEILAWQKAGVGHGSTAQNPQARCTLCLGNAWPLHSLMGCTWGPLPIQQQCGAVAMANSPLSHFSLPCGIFFQKQFYNPFPGSKAVSCSCMPLFIPMVFLESTTLPVVPVWGHLYAGALLRNPQ